VRGEVDHSPAARAGEPDAADVASAIRAVRSGNRDAFRIVVCAFESRLLRFARALVGAEPAAEDLAQTALVRAYQKLESYDADRPFFPWLAKIWAENARRQRDLAVTAEQADGDADPLARLVDHELRERLWGRIDCLPRAQRAAVILYYREELSVDETARTLGSSPGTVKTLLFRARASLRDALGGCT
jgi:RNA polymerase sigma-70 factor (ECF subfamily)